MQAKFALLFLLFGVFRALTTFTDAAPIYLDQGDGQRLGHCVGLSPQQQFFSENRDTKPLSRPAFFATEISPEQCEWSSATVLPWLVKRVALLSGSGADLTLDARALALAYLACFLTLALVIHQSLSHAPRWQVTAALIFALVICDPANTLYFGTLLTEPAALLGCYGVAAAFCLSQTRRLRLAAIMFVVFCAMTTFSRYAHFALPVVFLVPMFHALRQRAPRIGAAMVVCALSLSVIGLTFLQSQSKYAFVNRPNAITHAAAPLAEDAQALLRGLGLPENCMKLAGVSWHTNYGHDLLKTCPELSKVSARAWALTLAAEPALIVRVAYKSLLFMGSAKQNHLINGLTPETRPPHWSIFDPLQQFDLRARLALVFLAAALLLLSLRNAHKHLSNSGVSALLATAGTVWMVSVVGDGFSELSRHAHLAYSMLAIAVTIWVVSRGVKGGLWLLLMASISFVAATFVVRANPMARINPMPHNGAPGLLVVASEPIARVDVSLAGASYSPTPITALDNRVSLIVSIRDDMLAWVPVQTLSRGDTCQLLIVDFGFASGRTRRESVCIFSL